MSKIFRKTHFKYLWFIEGSSGKGNVARQEYEKRTRVEGKKERETANILAEDLIDQIIEDDII